GIHPDHVFVYKGKAIHHMLHSAWRKARKRANLAVRVHDLKHTFGRRLRAAGVGFEDRQDLLGHRSGRITTHYSSPELQNLYQAANKVCGERPSGVVLSFVQHAHQRRVKGGLGQEASHKNVPQLSSVPLGPANLPQGVLGGIG
ncbi:MAG: site-specific integrase, partial [Gammaproteobacteria bacterium]|nr:site-specific integrase [Gammaproteobacteria bacterium]